MNIHKNARLTPQGRLLLVERITEQRWGVGQAAQAAGLSTRQAYRWCARYRSGGEAALNDRSSAPQHCPHRTPEARVAEIADLRRQRLTGPAIARQLGMPASTVGKVLRRLGLGKLTALEPKSPAVRYERERPGELIHIDSKKLGRIEGVGHRITGRRPGAVNRHHGIGWEALHICIDDASRLAYSEILPDEKKESAIGFLNRALGWFRTYGITVQRVMTDNGSAYRSRAFAPPSRWPAPSTNEPGPTRRAPMAKPSASSRPACASGLTLSLTPVRSSALRRWGRGSSATTPLHYTHLSMPLKRKGFVDQDAVPRGVLHDSGRDGPALSPGCCRGQRG